MLGDTVPANDYVLAFRRYGKDAVLGPIEFETADPHEIGLVIDVVGRTQDIADRVCAITRALLLHRDYEGRKATAGNIAFPYSPSDIAIGPVYNFKRLSPGRGGRPQGNHDHRIHGDQEHMTTLVDLARVMRSKNAGPMMLTIDVMFDDDETYRRVNASGVLSPATVAQLYDVSDNAVRIIPFDLVRTVKVTLPRRIASGDIGDTDIYGCQHHAPLANIEIP